MSIRRIAVLAACCAVAAVFALPTTPETARAEYPDPIVIDLEYVYYAYGDPEPPGSFTISGGYEDSGVCTLTSSVVNGDGSITMVHELEGAHGTMTVQVDLDAEYWGFVYTSRRVGTFTVLSGTDAYADLDYEGDVLQTTTSSGGWGVGWGYYPSFSYTTSVYQLDSDPPENVAPVANLTGNPSGTEPYVYYLSAGGSWDEDGIPVKFEWDFDGNGTWDAVTQGGMGWISHDYEGPGTWTAAVRVTDNDGATDEATHQVVITDPPTVTITAPAAGSTVSGTSVTIAANATNAISMVFYVDAIPVGNAASGNPSVPWSAGVLWDSTQVANGPHTIMVVATGLGMTSATDTIQVTVANGPPLPPPLSVTGIQPNSVPAGSRVWVTVTGTGFVTGASLTFRNGAGSTPVASKVTVSSGTSLTALVRAGKRGPKGERVWHVVVTNPNGQSATLTDRFTVIR
jgi:hypothetical protein